MLRRNFLYIIFITILGAGSMGTFLLNSTFFSKLYYKIKNRINPSTGPKPDSARAIAILPEAGTAISVETALNSRCTSDYDDIPQHFHWGMFDKTKKLSSEQIKKIMKHAKIPRFTDVRTEIRNEQNMLIFIIDNRASGISKNWLMVENGMQQQAIGLVCSALGVGMVFSSVGSNRPSESEGDYVTTRIKLDPIKPSYEGAFWTTQAPSGPKPWLKGNLPDPARSGQNSLLETLAGLQTHHDGRNKFSEQSLSQLLWAARGRTPHYYKSEPWGLTIPTNRGEQNITSIYVMTNKQASQYVNWSNNKPTHSLKEIKKIDTSAWDSITGLFPEAKYFLIITKNIDTNWAYWETGYQLLNILLQARALNISYRAALLNENQIKTLQTSGISNAVAVIGI
jgi:hypothetical protein